MVFSDKVLSLVEEGERELADIFRKIDNTSFYNTQKIMEIFAEHRVSTAHFDGTSGYGYDDKGRDTLDRIWADVMGAEAAFVRHQIVNGTQALTIGLFGLLRPSDILFSIAGKPYDTLDEVIGNTGTAGNGSLRDFGVASFCEIKIVTFTIRKNQLLTLRSKGKGDHREPIPLGIQVPPVGEIDADWSPNLHRPQSNLRLPSVAAVWYECCPLHFLRERVSR